MNTIIERAPVKPWIEYDRQQSRLDSLRLEIAKSPLYAPQVNEFDREQSDLDRVRTQLAELAG